MDEHLGDVLRMLEEQRESLVGSEELAGARIENLRALIAAAAPIHEALAHVLGLSSGVRRSIASNAVLLAAAQADFDAHIQAREALDTVLEELRSLEEGAG